MKAMKKSRKGFTLVEVMLSVAIICLLGGCIASLCMSISGSFTTTYNIDDAADYAMLYAKGFENSFLATTQMSGNKNDQYSWYISTTESTVPTLRMTSPAASEEEAAGNEAVFDPQFLSGVTADYKWEVLMFYRWNDASESVEYRVLLQDKFSDTDYVYMYEGSFWVPRYSSRKANNKANGRSIAVSGAKMNETTLATYGIDTSRFSTEQLDGTYQAVITYTWDADS